MTQPPYRIPLIHLLCDSRERAIPQMTYKMLYQFFNTSLQRRRPYHIGSEKIKKSFPTWGYYKYLKYLFKLSAAWERGWWVVLINLARKRDLEVLDIP